jgi:3-oxoacyl-[acyl-carrier protein] reductase
MLEGKIALVTGASRGIGKAIALQFAAQGATVIVNYNGNKEKALQVVEEITAAGGKAQAYGCNVANDTEVADMVKAIIEQHKRIDILVNNAGVTKDGLLLKMKDEDFDKVLDVNLKGTFHCIKYVSRYMLKQRYGIIINMSSVVGLEGNAGQINYAASKAGVVGMTQSAAKELGSRHITVNAIAPGYIETDMTASLSEELRKKIQDVIVLGRLGSPEDIANTAVFLASDMAAYITGQVIRVDGGMHV